MIAKGKYTKGTHMKVTDILKEQSADDLKTAIMKDREKILGPIPADYNGRNPMHNGWRTVIASAHKKCFNDNAKSIQNGKPVKSNRKFNITYEYLWELINKQEWKCAITNTLLEPLGDSLNNNRISIDRINSSKGYVPGNIQFIKYRVNTMKWTHDQSNFIKFCMQIVNYTNKHGIPPDPADQLTTESIIESANNIFDTWKAKREPLMYFLTSNTNEPLYTNLATKTPWVGRSGGNAFEKSYLTPNTTQTLLNWVNKCESAFNNKDAALLKINNDLLTTTINSYLRSVKTQLLSGKYPEEIGTSHSVIKSLNNFKIGMQALLDGKKMPRVLDQSRETTTADGRYMTQLDRNKLENFIAQIDQISSNRPTFQEAKDLQAQIAYEISRIAHNTKRNIANNITPVQFIAHQVGSSKYNVVDDKALTPNEIAALDPRLQKRILSQQSRGMMPADWDKSNLEHKSWKKVLDNAFTRVLRLASKRNSIGKDALDKHNFNANNKELWDVITAQNWICPYTGIKLEATGERSDNQLSPDRINSNLGYISGNIRFVAYRVNVMKSDRSSADFVNSCKQIVDSQRSKKP